MNRSKIIAFIKSVWYTLYYKTYKHSFCDWYDKLFVVLSNTNPIGCLLYNFRVLKLYDVLICEFFDFYQNYFFLLLFLFGYSMISSFKTWLILPYFWIDIYNDSRVCKQCCVIILRKRVNHCNRKDTMRISV